VVHRTCGCYSTVTPPRNIYGLLLTKKLTILYNCLIAINCVFKPRFVLFNIPLPDKTPLIESDPQLFAIPSIIEGLTGARSTTVVATPILASRAKTTRRRLFPERSELFSHTQDDRTVLQGRALCVRVRLLLVVGHVASLKYA
jgi:hypothetical protein